MEQTIYRTWLDTPLGPCGIEANDEGITFVGWTKTPAKTKDEHPHLDQAVKQLEAYFAGTLKTFDLPLAAAGTPFQKQVWDCLLEIDYGQTLSYLDIAKQLGDPKATRAVGTANGRNPIGIIIPCHRVIGNDGKLTGYAAGVERKRWLLNLENNSVQTSLF